MAESVNQWLFDVLCWRLDAFAQGSETTRGGPLGPTWDDPRAPEKFWAVKQLKDIGTAVEDVKATVEALDDGPTVLDVDAGVVVQALLAAPEFKALIVEAVREAIGPVDIAP